MEICSQKRKWLEPNSTKIDNKNLYKFFSKNRLVVKFIHKCNSVLNGIFKHFKGVISIVNNTINFLIGC